MNALPIITMPSLALLGLVVLAAGRLVYGERDQARDFTQYLLRVLGWLLFVVGFLGMTAQWNMAVGMGLTLLGMAILIAGLARLKLAGRSSLMTLMAMTIERGMPLAPAIAAFGEEWGGRFGRRALRFAEELTKGGTLEQAARKHPRLLSSSGQVALSTGALSGDLPTALRQAAETDLRQRCMLDPTVGRCLYLTWMLFFVLGIVTFMVVRILPVFESVYSDFGVELPRFTQFLLQVSYSQASFPLPMMLAFLGILGLNMWLTLAYLGFHPPRPQLFDRLNHRWHFASVLRPLSLLMEKDVPLDRALTAVGEGHSSAWTRKRLKRAGLDVSAGADGIEALCHGMLASSADLALLRSAQRLGNLPWAMRELAEFHERRVMVRVGVWSKGVFMLCLLGIAFLVAVIAVGSLMPLSQMMARLSAGYHR